MVNPVPPDYDVRQTPVVFPLVLFLFFLVPDIYSTVTDLAKFLGKSTFKPSATASQ